MPSKMLWTNEKSSLPTVPNIWISHGRNNSHLEQDSKSGSVLKCA